MSTIIIDEARPQDVTHARRMAVDTGLFGYEEFGEVEQRLRDLGPERARVLLIETSSAEQYVNTRAFYLARGYTQEATIRDYYGPQEHKVIFWKQLHS